MNILTSVGNIIFVIISSKLKNDPDEYIQFLNYTRNNEITKWNNSIGLNCMEWNHRRIKCMYGRFSCELKDREKFLKTYKPIILEK